MIRLSGQFVPIKVNAEKEGAAAAKKYSVNGFPTILFVDGAGTVQSKIGGYMPAGAFGDELVKIQTAYRDLPLLEAKHKASPGNAAVSSKLAAIYAGKGNLPKASQLLADAEKSDPGNSNGKLTTAYNAVADGYQTAQQFDKAIPLFRKAAKTSKVGKDKAYALISIAVCYFSQQKFKDGIPDLEALLAMPDAPADLAKQAKQYLEMAKQQK